ncbi:MAG: TetR/AcrR family transcriptional regulator [Proteobacteria bacterium]|nr:TetR/AcrR family transcriptional regulator [Pseudomonadota bacterium]
MASTNKHRILQAAEKLIPRLGIHRTTIAKVAREADVADSLVYKYFENKEDLLFSVADIRLREVLAVLDEQLGGIIDPESRLRKLIWHTLNYHDLHPNYVKLLFFECCSNARFYRSPTHGLIREHSKVTRNILDQGVQSGVFRSDVNMRLVRELIYGMFNIQVIGRHAANEIQACIDDFDDIFDLILAMIRENKMRVEPSREDRILRAAEQLFARKGFHNSKVADIAQLAGVAEGSLYDLYKNKANLLNSIAEKRFSDHLRKSEEAFLPNSAAGKLRHLMRYHYTLYMANPDFLKVSLLDMLLNLNFYRSSAWSTFKAYLARFEHLVEEGREGGAFRPEVNPRVFRNLFLGAFSYMAFRWLLFEDKMTDKIMEIDQLIEMLVSSIVADKMYDSK